MLNLINVQLFAYHFLYVNQKLNESQIMKPVQAKMARAALGLTVRSLADLAGVSHDTVVRLERGDELKPRTVDAIRAALETAGVIFIDENGEGPGVRLRK